jgi:hypothetical protein
MDDATLSTLIDRLPPFDPSMADWWFNVFLALHRAACRS